MIQFDHLAASNLDLQSKVELLHFVIKLIRFGISKPEWMTMVKWTFCLSLANGSTVLCLPTIWIIYKPKYYIPWHEVVKVRLVIIFQDVCSLSLVRKLGLCRISTSYYSKIHTMVTALPGFYCDVIILVFHITFMLSCLYPTFLKLWFFSSMLVYRMSTISCIRYLFDLCGDILKSPVEIHSLIYLLSECQLCCFAWFLLDSFLG